MTRDGRQSLSADALSFQALHQADPARTDHRLESEIEKNRRRKDARLEDVKHERLEDSPARSKAVELVNHVARRVRDGTAFFGGCASAQQRTVDLLQDFCAHRNDGADRFRIIVQAVARENLRDMMELYATRGQPEGEIVVHAVLQITAHPRRHHAAAKKAGWLRQETTGKKPQMRKRLDWIFFDDRLTVLPDIDTIAVNDASLGILPENVGDALEDARFKQIVAV